MDKCSYTFEMQLLLHPNFKNPDGALKRIVILCNLQAGASQQVTERHYTKVRRIVLDGVRKIMVAVDSTPNTPEVIAPPPAVVFSDDVMTLFADTADEILPQPLTTLTALHEQRIDDEFERWLTTPTTLRGASFSDFESVLTFWKRQQDMDTFRLLPLVARVVFSLPSSSAQIERDFGTASRMVVMPQRDSLAPHNVNMLTFLNSNRSYVNIAQCTKLSAGTASGRVSPNVMVNILQEQDDNWNSLAEFFPATSFDLGLSDEEDGGTGRDSQYWLLGDRDGLF